MDVVLRVAAVGLLLISIVGVTAAVRVLRRPAPVRPRFDVLRIGIALATALVVTLALGIETPPALIAGALGGGLVVGVIQGATSKATMVDGSVFASRTVIGVAIWGAGTIFTQAAGVLDQAGAANPGLAVAYFSAAMITGTAVGRVPVIRQAAQATAVAGVGLLLLAAPVALVFAPSPSYAQSETLEESVTFEATWEPLGSITTEDIEGFLSFDEGQVVADAVLRGSPDGRRLEVVSFDGSAVIDSEIDFSSQGLGGCVIGYDMDAPLTVGSETIGEGVVWTGTGSGTLSVDVGGCTALTDLGAIFDAGFPATFDWRLAWDHESGDFVGSIDMSVEGTALGGELSGSTEPLTFEPAAPLQGEVEEEAEEAGAPPPGQVDEPDSEVVSAEEASGAGLAGALGALGMVGSTMAEVGLGASGLTRALRGSGGGTGGIDLTGSGEAAAAPPAAPTAAPTAESTVADAPTPAEAPGAPEPPPPPEPPATPEPPSAPEPPAAPEPPSAPETPSAPEPAGASADVGDVSTPEIPTPEIGGADDVRAGVEGVASGGVEPPDVGEVSETARSVGDAAGPGPDGIELGTQDRVPTSSIEVAGDVQPGAETPGSDLGPGEAAEIGDAAIETAGDAADTSGATRSGPGDGTEAMGDIAEDGSDMMAETVEEKAARASRGVGRQAARSSPAAPQDKVREEAPADLDEPVAPPPAEEPTAPPPDDPPPAPPPPPPPP